MRTNMKLSFALILVVVLAIKSCNGQSVEKLLVESIRTDFLLLEDELWSFVLEHKENVVDPGIDVVKKFQSFDKTVQQMPQDILYGMEVPRQSKTFLTFFSDMRIIHDLYEKFIQYQASYLSPVKTNVDEYVMEVSTSHIVSDIIDDTKNNVNKTMERIHNKTSELLFDIFGIMSDGDYICKNPHQPPEQVFYNLYNSIAFTDLKGYILSQFAYLASRLQDNGNFTEASILARKEYKQRAKERFQIFELMMDHSSGNMYRCDPKHHVEGVTYEEVTRLVQAHIQNEVDLNPTGTCTGTCDTYSAVDNIGKCYDSQNDYCRYVPKCKGKIYNCQFIKSHMKTCISPPNSNRRYDYIEYDGGNVYGEKSSCARRNINSWFRWFVHCSYCLCFCDEQTSSDRFFNLRPVTADVSKNRVVTGLRLVKKNRIFHIQIQEGTLLPYGYIDQDTLRWVPLDEYTVFTAGVKRGVDYHIMDYNHRSLYLDDLTTALPNTLITGIKFIEGQSLQLEITITPFNFTTGKLNIEDSYQLRNNYRERRKIYIQEPDIPTRSPSSVLHDSTAKYIDFTHSDLKKDAAQTTIPFIDIQFVNAVPAVPLKSAGIYYKGKRGFGGFVGIRADTYDYKRYFDISFPTEPNRKDDKEIYKVVTEPNREDDEEMYRMIVH